MLHHFYSHAYEVDEGELLDDASCFYCNEVVTARTVSDFATRSERTMRICSNCGVISDSPSRLRISMEGPNQVQRNGTGVFVINIDESIPSPFQTVADCYFGGFGGGVVKADIIRLARDKAEQTSKISFELAIAENCPTGLYSPGWRWLRGDLDVYVRTISRGYLENV